MMLNFDELIKQKRINLSEEAWYDDDLEPLIKAIDQSTVIEELNLCCNNLTLADGKLADAIAKNTTLNDLNLYGNNISLQGLKHLADALKENKTLQVLSLGENNIGDEGAKYIA